MNPRYLAYCRAHGRDPEAMMAYDDTRWPGGCMCGFLLWIGDRWQDWKARHPEFAPPKGHDWVKTQEQYDNFDLELAEYGAPECKGRCCI